MKDFSSEFLFHLRSLHTFQLFLPLRGLVCKFLIFPNHFPSHGCNSGQSILVLSSQVAAYWKEKTLSVSMSACSCLGYVVWIQLPDSMRAPHCACSSAALMLLPKYEHITVKKRESSIVLHTLKDPGLLRKYCLLLWPFVLILPQCCQCGPDGCPGASPPGTYRIAPAPHPPPGWTWRWWDGVLNFSGAVIFYIVVIHLQSLK